ncbi:DUF5683 domain-containing protein [Costertonia aggregata]|uniref:DUF5683 domain-containing protein n=1 Tax=Costertonia aggregata TaxID=343403 RepID=A0A7H9AKS8_9FLAO|nr:DUF5683 domain-containing protein [Costertonia aggregata]QLG44081.1 hypothetical protein HYG79_01530 [Costertonia aggregata]
MLLFFSNAGIAQEEKNEKALDSVQQGLNEQGVIILKDSVFVEKKKINPLAPSKAAFYSAIFPGLGQIYNKRYWKVPIVYAAIGTGAYAYIYNNQQYNDVRDAFKSRRAGFTTDEFYDLNPNDDRIPTEPDIDNDDLQDFQERFQRDRDLALLITIALYGLNIIDANVDSHLKQFNVDDKLSMDFKPYLEYNPVTANPNYGMALTIKF